MTTITFLGGVDEIGGNKVLVRDGDHAILLDFGMSFGRFGTYYEEFLSPRTVNGMGDFLEMGLLPDLPGIYRADLLRLLGRQSMEDRAVDACFISHAHADHLNYVSFLRPDIAVHMGETAKLLVEGITEGRGRAIDFEVLDFKERPINRKEPPVPRDIQTFRTGNTVKVGDMEIVPVHVDHSVPGAYGFIIRTSEGTLVYSGDVRLHGSNPGMTEEFAARAAEAEPDALITEGTRIDSDARASEASVSTTCSDEMAGAGGKVVFTEFNFKDVDRLRTFSELALTQDRKLVIGYKEACILKRYAADPGLENVPSLDDDHIALFQPRKKSGTYDEKDYGVSERPFYQRDNVLTADQIHDRQQELIVFVNMWNFGNLIDMRPNKGSLYVHSLSEPFNDEMRISNERKDAWLDHFGLKRVNAHCSGHASGPELRELINRIAPNRLFPIHTEHPELFTGLETNDVVRVKVAKEYTL
ncbi:MAG: MBL fold metallo-hydrolase [Candidatus Undinarchaeales archaeon]|jgi:ribonuclease J|nr:MBL fold metallo-hydrolase [Candidatus Undinarchaeales archaeon]MDP7492539.1 MBL fold metallo-hydrolase [Candidatus Undinarchaeales archaeon]